MKKRKVIGLIILSLLFILMIIALKLNHLDGMDNRAFELLDQIRTVRMTNFFRVVTLFGNYIAVLIISMSLTLLFKNKKDKLLFIINVLSVGALSQILKFIFARPRPEITDIYRTSYSFPSAHTMLALGVYGFLIYMIYTKKDWSKKVKYALTTMLIIIVILVGISRVYLGYHFISDVIAAYLVTLIYLIIFTACIKKIIIKEG